MSIAQRLVIIITFLLPSTYLMSQNCPENLGLAENLVWNFEVQEDDLAEGDVFTVPCNVTNFEKVLTFQYTINFDPTVLRFLSIDDSGSPLNGGININPSPNVLGQGFIGVLWTNQLGEGQTLNPDALIYSLNFEVIGDPGSCADFQINSSFITLEIAFEPTYGSICTEIDNINYEITTGDICLACNDQPFINSNLCNGELEFSVCGGFPPYVYTIGGFNLQDQGMFDADEILAYSGLENEGLITISVGDAAGNNTVLSLSNEPHPPLEISGDVTCEFGLLSAPNNFTDYEWISPAGERFTTNLDEPWLVEVFQGGLYTLFATYEDCRESTEIFLDIPEVPELLENQFTVCNSAGLDPSTVVLDSIISNSTGNYWSSSDMNISLDVLDFEGNAPGEYIINIYAEGIAPCFNELFTITVQVLDCACPALDLFSIGNYCNDEETIINLFDLLSPDSSTDGVFSIFKAQGDLADVQPDLDGNLIIDQNFIEGDYTLRYQLSMAPPGCPSSSQQAFSVFKTPQPITINPDTFCNTDTIGFASAIDLSQFVFDAEGSWQDQSGNILDDSIIDFVGTDPGIYEFIFTTSDAQAPCPNVSVSIQAQVVDCTTTSTQDFDIRDINIYPNPNQGIFHIDAQGKWDIVVYNVTGVLILQQSIEPGVNQIRLDDNRGLFLVAYYKDGKLIGNKKVFID